MARTIKRNIMIGERKIITIIMLMCSINSYAQRFGIEDNTGNINRFINMQHFGFGIDSGNSFYIRATNPSGTNSLININNSPKAQISINKSNRISNVFVVDSNGIFIQLLNKSIGIGQIQTQHFSYGNGYIPLNVNGSFSDKNGTILTKIFTPSNTTDNTYPNGTMTADDNYLYFRKSNGTWVKIQWMPFNSL